MSMNIRAILSQLNTYMVQDLHCHILLLEIMLSILFYMVVADIIQIVISPRISLVVQHSLKNMRLNMLFISLLFQKNFSSIYLYIR